VTGDPLIAEMFGVVGADFVVIDMEAAPIDKADCLACVQALAATPAIALVRVPWLERHWIEHALDIGSHGVVVPKIDSAEDARWAVDAAFFPPKGKRGLNPVRASRFFTAFDVFIKTANDRVQCFLQIESLQALAELDHIAAVPGVSGLFIGAGDLAACLGHPGDMSGPGMDEARAAVLAACARNGLVPGIFAYSLELAKQYAEEGFQMIAVGNEIKILAAETIRALEEVRPGGSTVSAIGGPGRDENEPDVH
jgi:2-keto-3-deoxy-L-rhamnonate aldolase RhmA